MSKTIVKNNKFNLIDIFLRTIPDQHLFTVCEEVTNFDKKLKEIVELMVGIMNECGEKILSANQVGFDKRIILVKDIADGIIVLVNPEISFLPCDYVKIKETCTSIPKYSCVVKRPLKVRISCRDLTGKRSVFDAENELAYRIIHGVEHLDGVLITAYDDNFGK